MNPGDISAAASKASKAESLACRIGTFTKSIAVSSAKNTENIINLQGRMFNDIKGAAVFVYGKLIPPSAKAIKDFGKALQNKAGNLKRLIPQRQAELAGGFRASVGPNIEFSEVVENLKNGVGEVKDNFVDAIKNGNKRAIIKHMMDNMDLMP
ncbi:hypothetical protein [Clostridium felsineum]|uniref:hypothetical protein n=1 Tax=Clostridium felsineum TaxID=36839 RepID=UPI00098BE125|nr:hypothetical protein [Clostridium felsineum]URZ15088.1 hypothetical protein CLFE_011050 [Clostridium felsineum DSM 794]